ncbi:anti-Muellerian hormone type-2 receptor-like isoform X2 [Betta splendens]|uniref:receptor protein serine/threonine kinase n=1 Tax=Betta splendens TaxID=158456 RepID=A0A8M1HEV8_BETSP|nr:anti-Muellerian hormone type-2 receptor-like isoform X2 [Betta splendens]
MVQGVNHVIFTVGCIVLSGQALRQRRQCAFQSGKRNNNLFSFSSLGNVTGSIQVCENTECCVGFFEVINNQAEVDILACNVAENDCPDSTCKPVMLHTGKNLKCVCNADLCNSNITWSPETPRDTYSYSADKIMIPVGLILTGTICLMIVAFILRFTAVNRKGLVTDTEMKPQWCPHYCTVGDLCSCLTAANFSEIDIADIELSQGSLHSYLCEHTSSWMLSLKLCQSLSEGLSYLHSDLRRDDVHKPSVAHGDLSSSNILVRADGSCVLCDFDCSTILQTFSRNKTTIEGHAWKGTLRYMSPEILQGNVNLSSSSCLIHGDIYSLGLLLWEIWMRCSDLFQGGLVAPHLLPYEHELGPIVTIESLIWFVDGMQRRPTIPKEWAQLPQGSALQDLLSDCWDCDPEARLTVTCVSDRLSSLQSSSP